MEQARIIGIDIQAKQITLAVEYAAGNEEKALNFFKQNLGNYVDIQDLEDFT